MNKYFMKRNGVISGPFTIAELRNFCLQSSDLFALSETELIWLRAFEIPDFSVLFISFDETSSQFKLPDSPLKKPEKAGFRKRFTETEFSIYFRNFLDRIQTARVASLFIILLASTLFIKATLDLLVINNFEYLQPTMIHSPNGSENLSGPIFQNAIVKSYIHPLSTDKKYSQPGRPKDVFKLIQVKGKSFPANPSSLLITVTNQSLYLVDNAEIEVIYETSGKPFIEKYLFKFLNPLASKTMTVPLTKQNTHIIYRVVNIYTSQYTALEREV
jgi:hypothetical protein